MSTKNIMSRQPMLNSVSAERKRASESNEIYLINIDLNIKLKIGALTTLLKTLQFWNEPF